MVARDDHGRAALTEVPLRTLPLAQFERVLTPHALARLRAAVESSGPAFAGRTVWNVNSTARGGGVAELLHALLPLARDAGVDARWLVIAGDGEFFRLTKRLHNLLHENPGDGGPLGEAERAAYESAVAPAAAALGARVRAGDLVLLHDPQTAGLIPGLLDRGIGVIWRAHIGVDRPGELARSAQDFLAPYVERADVCVFSRPDYAWDVVPVARRAFISPSIDPFSPKNEDLGDDAVAGILHASGLMPLSGSPPPASFARLDGTPGTVRRRAEVDRSRPLRPDDRYVLQVSRWDALKDPAGVLEAFARHVAPHEDVHLVYAGPSVMSVTDDPEGTSVLASVRALQRSLPPQVRDRIHLAEVPMEDPDENAAIVNALQRRASVIVQKSLAEGFGLTVAEAMWKARPVVASALGGILDQVEHRRSGLLVDDPRDGAAFGAAVLELLRDDRLAGDLGRRARERVREHFLSDRSLVEYLQLLGPLASALPVPSGRR